MKGTNEFLSKFWKGIDEFEVDKAFFEDKLKEKLEDCTNEFQLEPYTRMKDERDRVLLGDYSIEDRLDALKSIDFD